MEKQKQIAVLLTCFNRKEKTINCLNNVFNQILSNNISITVFLVDDGSSDGTSEAVEKLFPEVIIIKGNGNLYWNRGMHLAWETASKKFDYDYYCWLNDDTFIFKKAISLMVNAAQLADNNSIICGATQNFQKTKTTYSGKKSIGDKLLDPNGLLQKCEIFNGNFVLIPKSVFKIVGNLDWTFRHAIGDFDYALRAKSKGINCYLAPEYVGMCESNPTLPKWCLTETPLTKRFKLLYSPLGYAEPIPFFIYEKRHFGLVTAVKHFISINLRALLPSLWRKK